MKKNKKALKGFTLIELIIVLALFSVIMTLVLSFIDPLSRLMTKTSIKERTASYADNIGTYVDKSIRYAQFVRVFENDFCENSNSKVDTVVTEEQAVKQFVDDFFDGVVESGSGLITTNEKDEKVDIITPLSGQVHVMKFINTPVNGLEEGRIYETVYNFTAGDSKPLRLEGNKKDWITESKVEVINNSENVMVLNDEHFIDYSYFYSLGLYNFEPITTFENDKGESIYKVPGGGITEDPSAKTYYSRLIPRGLTSGSSAGLLEKNEAMENINASNLVVNIVSYQKGNKFDVNYNTGADGESDVAMSVFQSPSSMESIGMTLRNITGAADAVNYYCISQAQKAPTEGDPTGPVINDTLENDASHYKLVPITSFASDPFTFYRCTDPNVQTQNLYFIYTVPSETADSKIDREGKADEESSESEGGETGGETGGEGGHLPPPPPLDNP